MLFHLESRQLKQVSGKLRGRQELAFWYWFVNMLMNFCCRNHCYRSTLFYVTHIATLPGTHWVQSTNRKPVKRLLLWLKAQSFGMSPTRIPFQACSYVSWSKLLAPGTPWSHLGNGNNSPHLTGFYEIRRIPPP